MAEEGKKINDASLSEITEPTGEEQIAVNNGGVDAVVRIKNLNKGDVDSIQFNTNPPIITTAGTVQWNNEEYTINVNTGLGATIQVGQETLILYYNDTGSQLDNFTILHPKSAIEIGSISVPTPEKADASKWELCEGTLAVATHDIPNNTLGFATRFGQARNGDSTGWGVGVQLWVSADGSGLPTATKPVFPNYSISLGGRLKEHATEGVIFVSVTKAVGDTFNDSWDGGIRETFDFTVSSNGTIVTGLLENINALNNLTLFFSDGTVFYTLDTTTTPLTIALTSGTDEITVTNYIYIPISTKVLTLSTSGFPATEHCRIATLEIQSALNVQSVGGSRGNQNHNDHLKLENDNGHILHIAGWIRKQFATWEKGGGVESTFDASGGNGYVSVGGGTVNQLHPQVVGAITMPSRDILVANDPDTPWSETDNLNTITKFSDGSNWSNKWGKIVVWLIANKTGEPDFICVNLPRAGENDETKAMKDEKIKAIYSIASEYKSKAILLGAFAIKVNAGVITYNGSTTGYQDLRGTIPSNISGGGVGGVSTLLALDDVFAATHTGKQGQVIMGNGTNGVDYNISPQQFSEFNDTEEGNLTGLNNGMQWFNTTVEKFKAYIGGAIKIIGLWIDDGVGNISYIGGNVSIGTEEKGAKLNVRAVVNTPTYNSGILLTQGADDLRAFSMNIDNDGNGELSIYDKNTSGKIYLSSKSDSYIRDVNMGFGLTDPVFQAEFLNTIGIRNAPPTNTINSNPLVWNATTKGLEQVFQLNQVSTASTSTLTPTGNYKENEQYITALAVNLSINIPSGTPLNGNTLVIRIYAAGVQTLTWNAIYKDFTGSLPSATIAGKELYVGCAYNSRSSKWDVLSVILEP
jgi:hypothetical protein